MSYWGKSKEEEDSVNVGSSGGGCGRGRWWIPTVAYTQK